MLYTIIGYIVGIFIFCPLNLFIHELGHAFFIKLFGGKIKHIHIGVGDSLFTFSKFIVHRSFFIFGFVEFDEDTLKIHNTTSNVLIGLGGVLFNALSLIVVIIIFNLYDPSNFLKGYYIGFTLTLILSALVPITYSDGTDSDGKGVLKNFSKNIQN